MFKDIYSEHPSFETKERPYVTSKDLISEVNRLGELIWQPRIRLKASEAIAINNKAKHLLNQIFGEMKTQAPLGLPLHYLEDLEREAASLAAEDTIATHHGNAPLPVTQKQDNEQHIADLLAKGYLFTHLKTEWVSRLSNAAAPAVRELRKNERNNLSTRDKLSQNSGQAVWQCIQILQEAFTENGILDIMGSYCGHTVHVSGLALEIGSSLSTWWHSPYDEIGAPVKTLYMHRDETIRNPKAFIYLSDINKSNGAFSVVPNANEIHGEPSWLQNICGRRIGSIGKLCHHKTFGCLSHAYHRPFADPVSRQLFMKLPPELRYNSHYGWDLSSNSRIHERLLEDEIWLEGEAGSMLIFDGARVTHRALVNSNSSHLSIQAIFDETMPHVTPQKPRLINRIKIKAKSALRIG